MTTTTIDTPVLAQPRAARVLPAYFAEIRCEFLRTLRNPALAFPILALPVGLYALFAGVIFGEAMSKDPSLGIFMFAAFSIMAVTMPALFSIGAGLAMEREMGLLKLKRAQPAPAGTWLVAKIVAGIGLGVVAYAPLVVVALLTGKLPLDGFQIVAVSGVLVASAIPFCALGLMVGTLASGSAAPGYANLLYLPGCYLSGMFFPLPASMHWQAPFWPQFHVVQLAMHAAGATKYQFMPVQISIAALAGFTVLFSAVSIWRLARNG
jgi:ABC-2 type transport system permease protein